MKDKQGREYAKLSQLKVGDNIQVDDGFTCIEPNVTRTVYSRNGNLCIECAEVHHVLDGQLARDGDSLIGVYKV